MPARRGRPPEKLRMVDPHIHTLQWIGGGGLAVAGAIGATISDNTLLVGAAIGILVGASTLLLRIFSVVDTRVRSEIERMQAHGDLPTRLERQEQRRALELINEKMDRLLARTAEDED